MVPDIFIAGSFTQETIRQAVLCFLKDDQFSVKIIEAENLIDTDLNEVNILLATDHFEGNFYTRLAVYTGNEITLLNNADFCLHIAKQLNVETLVTYWSDNPFLWILIEPDGHLYRVEEQPSDANGVLFIDRSTKIKLTKAEVNEKLFGNEPL